MVKNLMLAFLLISLVFVSGCAPKIKPAAKEPETAEEFSQSIDKEVSSLDEIQEDIDLKELDTLDDDLAELENLEMG